MADYGHDLQFGLFLSPEAASVDETLELAQLAEVTGLDLVTVQDHPYQARHVDAWTLLSVIAARTTAVRVAPNVANLPLRPPAVLAQSVASLDLLSGGRVELGLGAGAFWDAIAAAGGPRRTPKEAVDALVEAIRIIRGVWGRDGQRSVTVEGEHYSVKGLHAGPAPVHDVEIWLGAVKPRMLRVTGRLADGWLPSLGYVPPEALPGMNAVIDEAAERAGRGPVAVRRMYNIHGRFGSGAGFLHGTPGQWAEQLAAPALETGMSTYILATDSADDVRRFAEEVAPATRGLVEDERARRAASAVSAVSAVSSRVHKAGAADAAGSAHPTVETAPGTAGSAHSTLGVVPTPDDGTRLGDTMPWREDDRPSRAQPSPAAYATTYTAAQQANPQHLLDIHDHLRQELAQVRDVIEQVRRGLLGIGAARSIINTMAMRQNNWTLGAYCESYCRVVTGHHTLEDRSVFPHLRRADPDLAPVLERLEQEHHVVADVLEQLDEALVGLVGAGEGVPAATAALDELQRAVDLLTDTLLSHLAYEERELFHPLARHGFG
jgi:alkanesulfonate monooxygenase SsuD/methylene tetrahydromethanopterin reductase-like flavin-dependent oxidoreductase (luciferase family)/hemerythrin-like domain-containing protein